MSCDNPGVALPANSASVSLVLITSRAPRGIAAALALSHLPHRTGVGWLGWKDSNLRMAGSKPAALPLGDTPAPEAARTAVRGRASYQPPYLRRRALSCRCRGEV